MGRDEGVKAGLELSDGERPGFVLGISLFPFLARAPLFQWALTQSSRAW